MTCPRKSQSTQATNPRNVAPMAHVPAGAALKRGGVWAGDGLMGVTVRCESGLLWLTQEGDRRDIVLAAGEVFTLTRQGRVVLSAIEPGAFSLRRNGLA